MTEHTYIIEVTIRKEYRFTLEEHDAEPAAFHLDPIVRKDFPGLTSYQSVYDSHYALPVKKVAV